MDISPYKFNQPGGEPQPDYVHVVRTLNPSSFQSNFKKKCLINFKASCPDTYRGKFNRFDFPEKSLAELYAQEIRDIIQDMNRQNKGPAAFIAESLQSCGGQIIPPDGYFQAVYQ